MSPRSKAGGGPVKTGRRKTARLKRGKAQKAVRDRSSSAAGQETKVARLTRELREALDQQTGTSEVLRVISSSPGELKPVFHAMLANAVRICDANFGTLFRYDNESFDTVAVFGVSAALAEFVRERGSFQPDAGTALDRLLRTKEVISIADNLALGTLTLALMKASAASSFPSLLPLNAARDWRVTVAVAGSATICKRQSGPDVTSNGCD